MNRIISFAIFFTIFLVVFLGIHLYVFIRLSSLLGISRNVWFYVMIALSALSFPLVSMVERFMDGPVCRILYTLASVWVGAVFLLFCTLILYEIVSRLVKIESFIAGIAIIIIVFVLVSYSVINARFINVKSLELPVEGLQKEVSIVQLSDIHVGTINNHGYLQRIVDKVNGLKPDMVLITGDLVDGSGIITNDTIKPLDSIKAKTFFTTGNHEMYEGVDFVVGLLNKTNVKVLQNKVAIYKGIQIVGIDNPQDDFKDVNLVLRKAKLNSSMPSVLMFHPPVGFNDSINAGIDLQLSGHTHRGQIMPFNLFTHIFYHHTYGLYEKNGTYLYVSPGTGTWGPPMRLGSTSEITYIKLLPG